MIGRIDLASGGWIVLRIGRVGLNEPVYAGTVVFSVIGLILAYLTFFHDEMDASTLLKVGSVMFFVLAIVSAFWPMRPWPH